LQVGGREIDTAPVGVGVVVVQSIRPRAYDASVDDELFQLKARVRLPIRQLILEVFEDFQLLTGERSLKAVWKADEELILVAGRRPRDNTDSAAGMHEGVLRSPNFDQRHDLCPGRDVIGRM
jgi:hypothetical protein